MRKIEMLFYNTAPSPKNTGLKFVLWRITTPEGILNHDWGFAEWDGLKWGAIDVPDGYEAQVVWWANTIDPVVLIAEPGKIIRPGK